MSEDTTVATVPASKPGREIRVVESGIALFDTGKFEHMYRIARGMAACQLIPEHLAGYTKDKVFHPFDAEAIVANCLLVVNQASRWDIDAYALAAETYVHKGKLGYQGKLIKAVVDARGGLKGGLRFRYNSKQGDEFAVVVYGSTDEIPEEAKPLLKALAESNDRSALSDLEDLGVKAVRLSVGQAKTDNQMWSRDPEQKLAYSGSVRWARRHRPDIILGIHSDDDSEAEEERKSEPLPRAILPAPKPSPAAEPVVTKTDSAPEVLDTPKKARMPRPVKAETPAAASEEKPTATEPAPNEKKAEPAAPATETPPPAEEEELEPAHGSEAELRAALAKTDYTEPELVRMAIAMNLCPTTTKTIDQIPDEKRQMIIDEWDPRPSDDWPGVESTLADIRKSKGGN